MAKACRKASSQRISGRWRTLVLLAATLVLSMTAWFSAAAVIPQHFGWTRTLARSVVTARPLRKGQSTR